MMVNDFLRGVESGQVIEFPETMAVIAEHYHYQPTEFSNGLQQPLVNEAGRNEGSCKIFAFAKLHQLTVEQTLALFGDYYRQDVLGNPAGSDHQNIRNFMRDGWEGIVFRGEALQAK
ncbi:MULTISPECIES: HopJ type III effector protein [Methylomonas]|uniref:Type III effector n=2 Tax=Methylomonas TaxID=416 RepID=A0A126T984_9GAMM|nr:MULTISPECIES: HopJ type III effector protein [Methylomonas]AMK78354.1 type III effector [Methylomonas denitrificans]OAI04064.1 type III effector [Methylomonas methanica]TCV87616.1 HopJ type III effector protein [Methylomonas methanica]